MPTLTGERIVEWIRSIATQPGLAAIEQSDDARNRTPPRRRLSRQTPLRFGKGNRIFGILCEPAGARRATALLLTTAYDRHRQGMAPGKAPTKVQIGDTVFNGV